MRSQAGVASTSLSATTAASRICASVPSKRVPTKLAGMSSIACRGSGCPKLSTAITNGGETTRNFVDLDEPPAEAPALPLLLLAIAEAATGRVLTSGRTQARF